MAEIEEASSGRVAYVSRLGVGFIPDASTVYRAGDFVHLVLVATTSRRRRARLDAAPRPTDHPGKAPCESSSPGRERRSLHRRELIRAVTPCLLIDRETDTDRVSKVPEASWLKADACELSALDEAGLADCDVVVAATGDDKVNLVLSLLAKTEFAVPRTRCTGQQPQNSGCSTGLGCRCRGVDARLMTALIEEAVSIGDLVRIFEFQQGRASWSNSTLPEGSAYAGARLGDITLPPPTRS